MRTTVQQMDQVDLVTRQNQSSTFPTSREVLHSWKEIAAELDRGVRTVQRWERTLQLPVRRLGDGPRSPVFAGPVAAAIHGVEIVRAPERVGN